MEASNSPYQQRSHALVATVSLCLCYGLFFFLVGAYFRMKSSSYSYDDIVALVATVSRHLCFISSLCSRY